MRTTRQGLVGTTDGFYDIYNFKPSDVNLDQIFNALGNICRYNGRCNRFFSVAQHSVFVEEIFIKCIDHLQNYESNKLALGCLCHDFAEAYTGDFIRPLKQMVSGIKDIEESIITTIGDAVIIGNVSSPIVKFVDNVALYNEASELGFDADSWGFSDEVKSVTLSKSCKDLLCAKISPKESSELLRLRYNIAVGSVKDSDTTAHGNSK